MSCVQSTVVEPAENILNRHTVQGLTDRLVQAVLRPRRDPAKLSLELRPQLLDRVVVRAVWRQGQDSRPCTLDRLRHVPREVGFEVVEDHHVPWAEFRDQYLIHIGLERLRVGRPGENQRRPYPIQAHGSDHGRRTPRGGHRALGPLTPPCPGVGRRHRRVDPRLVDENQPFCLDSPHLRPVSPPLGLHFGSVPLAGMQGLLLVGQAEAAEGAPEGRQGAGEAAPLLRLFQGGIGVLGDPDRQSNASRPISATSTSISPMAGGRFPSWSRPGPTRTLPSFWLSPSSAPRQSSNAWSGPSSSSAAFPRRSGGTTPGPLLRSSFKDANAGFIPATPNWPATTSSIPSSACPLGATRSPTPREPSRPCNAAAPPRCRAWRTSMSRTWTFAIAARPSTSELSNRPSVRSRSAAVSPRKRSRRRRFPSIGSIPVKSVRRSRWTSTRPSPSTAIGTAFLDPSPSNMVTVKGHVDPWIVSVRLSRPAGSNS